MTQSRDQVREINIGLLGLGVVGGGVAQTLLSPGSGVADKVGRPMRLRKILVRDPGKPRSLDVPASVTTTNPEEILDNACIQIVVEVIGGVDPAVRYLRQALSAGKHVVTANKEVMAKHGPELLALAQENQVNLLYEASVGGGIPIVGCLMSQLLANEVSSIRSIINGTTNYILTRMSYQRSSFAQALGEAQQRGYAEADPTNDVEGFDAVYKLAILASLAFHQRVRPEDIYREGITRLEAQDFRYAQELGYAIKSLAVATQTNGSILARVYPALVPLDRLLARVDGVYNAVEVEGNLCGRVLFHGQGAGQKPTTSAVVGDVIEIARKLETRGLPTPVKLNRDLRMQPIAELQSKYYFRVTVADQAGVLAQISRILGELNISIASVLQKDSDPAAQTAELVITTHPSLEAAMQQAITQVNQLAVVRRVNNVLRIEE